MKKILLLVLVVMLVSSGILFAGGKKEAAWPQKPISLIVSSSAGGGTDGGNRALGAALEKELGVKVNVTNVPAGSGAAACQKVYSSASDGYTMIGYFEGLYSFASMGIHDQPIRSWETYIIGGTPSLISVAADSKYQSIEDVVADMKARPGEVTLANSSVGCIWDIKATLFSKYLGVEYKFLPYNGSNPSILAALNGEVDVIITGLGEQAEFLAAKKLRPLACIEPAALTDVPGYGTVKTLGDYFPEAKDIPVVNQTIGMAVKADTPQEIKDAIGAAFDKAIKSDIMADYAKTKYVSLSGKRGDEAKAYGDVMASVFSWLLYDKGVAPNEPSKFGIAKP